MNSSRCKNLVVSLGLAIMASLFLRSDVYSKGKVGVWEGPDMYANRICTDGMRFGFSDETGQNWHYKFFKAITSDTFVTTPFATVTDVTLEPRPFGKYCQDQGTTVDEEDQFCKGTFLARWAPNTLKIGDSIGVEAYEVGYDNPADDGPVSLGGDDFTVSNCSVDDTPKIDLVRIGTDSTPPIVTDKLVFRIATNDPNWADEDGAGIQQVHMQIIGPTGTIAHQRVDEKESFCAFGGDSSCTAWNFAAHDNKWPNGGTIANGNHTLQAIVTTQDGITKIFTANVQIQLPESPTVTPTSTSTPTPTSTPIPTATPTVTRSPVPSRDHTYLPFVIR